MNTGRSVSPVSPSAAAGVHDAVQQNLRRIFAGDTGKIARWRVAGRAVLLEIRSPSRGVTCIHVLDRVSVAIDRGLLPRAQERGDVFNLRLRHLRKRRHLAATVVNDRADLVSLLIVERQS